MKSKLFIYLIQYKLVINNRNKIIQQLLYKGEIMQYFPTRNSIKNSNRLVLQDQEIRQPMATKKQNRIVSSYLKQFKKNSNSKVNKTYQSVKPIEKSVSRGKPILRDMEQENSHDKNLHNLLNQTDNSMQEMLNSSINQFQRILLEQGSNRQASLQQQNNYLRCTLNKLKIVLKDKLENALKRQKDELSKMLEDYITLITKLLQDKQQLTISLHDIQRQNADIEERLTEIYQQKLKQALAERDEHTEQTKEQIDEFLEVISQYQEEAKRQSQRFQAMQLKIKQLEALNQDKKSNKELQIKVEAQEAKIQALLQLMQKSQDQIHKLREELKKKNNEGQRLFLEQKMKQMQEQHQQEFLQYQRAIKQTLLKKDECISRLTLVIEGLRSKKKTNFDK